MDYIPTYNKDKTETTFRLYHNEIQDALNKFKDFYKQFDKRIATTKKKPTVELYSNGLYVSLTFNRCNYGQCYKFIDNNNVSAL